MVFVEQTKNVHIEVITSYLEKESVGNSKNA